MKITKSHRKYNKDYATRNKGVYLDYTPKKRKKLRMVLKTKLKNIASVDYKKKYKQMSIIKKGARATSAYFKGANEGLDTALGIPKRQKDYVLVSKVPKGWKIVRTKRRKIVRTKVPKGWKMVRTKQKGR